MTRKEFECCTWREFVLRFDGYQLRRAHELEGHRLVAYKILWAHMDHEKSRLPSIQEFWPLLSDDDEIKTEADQEHEEYNRLLAIMEAADKIKLN